jgi:uncharacterized protein
LDRNSILTILRSIQPELIRQGVKSLAIFGSVARGDFDESSDLDILVDFSYPVGIFEFIRLKRYLEQMTGCRIDLVTPDALRPEMKAQIFAEAIHVR